MYAPGADKTATICLIFLPGLWIFVEFAKHIKNEIVHENEILVSFDVEALFSSISVHHALAATR